MFDAAFLTALLIRQAVDFEDPALVSCLWTMLPCSLKARAMLARAKRLASSAAEDQDKSLSFLVETTETLNGLMGLAESQQLQEQRDLMIAEAAAHCYYWSKDDYKLYNNSNTMVALRSQNTLCGAIVLGGLPLVQTLLRERTDIDVNVESAGFGLPLHLAAAWGHVAIFQHLLESGADPCGLSHDAKEDPRCYHKQDNHSPRGSALRAAAGAGHGEIVQLLLSLPADCQIPATSPEYRHALFSAAQGGHMGCIELLLRATGRPLADFAHEHDELCEKMLCAAARGGHIDVASLLLDDPQLQLDVNAQGFGAVKNGSALHIAATRGDTALAKILVERYGADVDLAADESSRKCPYQVAARAGHKETLEFLLTASAREDAVISVFHSASRGAQLGILAWLVARYGREIAAVGSCPDDPWNPDNNDTVGQEALMMAIMDPAPDVILFLVREVGVPLNERWASFKGMLPVAVAKTECSRWVVDFLLRIGAEDVAVDEDTLRGNDRWDSFTTEKGSLSIIRGVRVSERTWQWV